MADESSNENVWKRLTRLFKSGPVVRHKIAAGEKIPDAQGTAKAFKKELSSLYVRALSSYANYERLSRYCFAGETLIPINLVEGEIRLDELVRRHGLGERFRTFSYDHVSGEVVSSEITAAFSTGVREVCEVEFEDGNVVQCTPDHHFMLRDGSYQEVGLLSPGTALMPFYRKEFGGYRSVYSFERGWVSEHTVVAEAKANRRFDRDCGWYVHHENFCKTDNTFDNLTPMSVEDYLTAYNRTNNDGWFENQVELERRVEKARSEWDRFAETYANSRIREVRRTGQFMEVYDLTIDRFHNFGIIGAPSSSICFVSNSDYNEMEFCLSGDTLIAVPGGWKRIDELAAECAESNESFIVFSYDHEIGRIVPALGKQARKTRTDHSWKVTFDNGKSIVATADHRFMLRDGSYRMTKDLTPGTAMMPFKRRSILAEDKNDPNEYQFIYLGKTSKKSGWASEHRMIAEFMLGRELSDEEEVHHLNFKRGDNRPENLKAMERAEHRAFHCRLNNEQKWNHKTNAEWIQEFKRRHSEFMKEHNPATRHDVSFEKILSIADQLGFNGDLVLEKLDTNWGVIYRRLEEKGFRDWTSFAKTYDPTWRNPSHDNQGEKNPRYDHELTFELICAAHEPGITPGELCRKLGKPRTRVVPRVQAMGFKNLGEFCKTYENCKVLSVEYHGIIDLYDLTVDGYKNFATNSIISHNTPELHSAIDIYSDEATVKNDDGDVVEITSRNAEIKEILETLFFDVIDINFNAWSWMRHFVKFGDLCLFVDANDQHGILNLIPIPINEIEREEGADPNDPLAVKFRWLTRGNTLLQNWQIIHFRLLGNDAYLPYGSSVLEPARRIWRQLILIEDAMLVYRIVRSPERRVFHIEIASTPPDQVETFIEQVKTQMKRNTIVDPQSGRVDLRYNPLSVEEDYFLPKRGEQKSQIDTLSGGQFPVRRSTMIPLLDGRRITIEQLASEYNEGKENWVYSVQDGTNSFVPGRVVWCGRNYVCNQIHRVWFDDGTYIDMAGEHPIVMRDGSRKRADAVSPGDSVMPFRTNLKKIGRYEYLQIQDPTDDEWRFVHRKTVSPHGITEAMDRSGETSVVLHHVDFDRFNNRPDNLQWMGVQEHISLHGENARRNLHTPEMDERNRKRITAFNKSDEGRAATSARNVERWKNQAFRDSHSRENHWNVRKWSKLYQDVSPQLLADFCLSNGIKSFKEFLEHADKPLKTDEQVRACLRYHGILRWTDFAAGYLGVPPRNHKISRVEVLEGISDDVFCMTVLGPEGEHDRHNFAVLSLSLDGTAASDASGCFLWNTGDIEDVQYIQSKMFAAIKIPRAYLGYEDQLGSKATLAQEDVRFSRTIERIQSLFVAELNKIAIIHLFLCGFSGQDLKNFQISMANPSTVAAQQRLELWRMKLEVAGMAQEGMFDRGFIHRKIFSLNDKQIAAIKDGKRIDKLEDTLLAGIESPPPTEPGAETAPIPTEPGAEELPNTLGGPEGPPEPAPEEQGPPIQAAGLSRTGPVMHERRNPGSTGNRAELAVDKGKDLFSTGENQLALSFGTEKQTASDPNDLRASRRMITRPFSEEPEVPMSGEEQIDESERLLELVSAMFQGRDHRST